MSVLNINKNNYAQLQNSSKPVLLDFYADWCGPCRMMKLVVDEVAKLRDDVIVGKVNVDEEPELAAAFSVSSIPMLVVMKDGKVVNSSVGAKPKAQVLKMLES